MLHEKQTGHFPLSPWKAITRHIDEQRQNEQQLKDSEESFRILAETVPQQVWVTRSDGLHDYINQRWRDYTGLTLEHFQRNRWDHLQCIHPDDRAESQALWQHALDTGTMYEHEERLRNGYNGEYRWFLTRAMLMRDNTGQIARWFGTCTDIEDQKRTEEALRQSQKRIRSLINSNIIGIVSVEIEEEVLTEANEAFFRMTGYTQEQVQRKALSWVNIVPPEQVPLFEHSIQELTMSGQHTPFETEMICQDGSRLPVLVSGAIFNEQPRLIVAFILDNSARKELDQRKDDWISMVSHELNTPLTVVKLQIQLERKRLEKHSQPEIAAALAQVEGLVKQLERLITELLDLSRMQAGKLEYRREPVELGELLQEVITTMRHHHPDHPILIGQSVQTGVIGDRDRLGQVFTNLINNAMTYSPDVEAVEIDLSSSKDVVMVHVRDHGLVGSREQLDKIFERFYQVTDPKQQTIPGLDIGLYIASEIVKHHGGTISVDSEVGTGSTFTVTLPKRREA